mgnify:CR=1 FL=1
MRKEIQKFCKDKNNILYVILGQNANKKELLFVLNYLSPDTISDYTDFCFQLKEKYNGFDDFLILDKNAVYQYSGIKIMYVNRKTEEIHENLMELTDIECSYITCHNMFQ